MIGCRTTDTLNKKKGLDLDAKKELIDGYKQMSRINLELAEEAVYSDNEAAGLCEENLRSVSECDC